jgi:hypothetical protein
VSILQPSKLWTTGQVCAIVAAMASLSACGGGSGGGSGTLGTAATTAAPAAAQATKLSILSSRPDMVSEGSALLKVDLPEGVQAAQVKVTAGGQDETSNFKAIGTALLGVVTGLPLGDNEIQVSAGGTTTRIPLTNHDRNGPIISGPHQTPFICETGNFNMPDGTKLGPAQDENCNVPTNVTYLYKNKDGSFKVLPDSNSLPSDVSTTTTTDGRVVNYVLRFETGTINRAIYQYAVLFDPFSEAPPSPATEYKAWNKKIIYSFGGSASAGYRQGILLAAQGLLNEDDKLSKGYLVAGSTLNVFGQSSSDVLSAETLSMVKERIIKTFGPALFTIGWGGSGGSMQQHLIANNYPGLLDGIVPSGSFSDLHSVVPDAVDCSLIDRAISGSTVAWTDAEKTAATGFNTYGTCQQWMSIYSPHWVTATRKENPVIVYLGNEIDTSNCAIAIPAGLLYDPVANPKGARCDIYSGVRNLVGDDPSTGFAARGYDNVGVQYGLKPLLAGTISAEQFVQLNEKAGGFDGDGNFQDARTAASPVALKNLYQFGRINDGSRLADLPVIDQRSDPELIANVHDSARSLTTRARILKAAGTADNHVVIRQSSVPPPPGSGATPTETTAFVLAKMDEWLSNIRSDSNTYESAARKVTANKPVDLTDRCITSTGEIIKETQDLNNTGRCGAAMPFYANPRIAAGGPVTDDVLKCTLVAMKRSDYAALTDVQFARLSAVFPAGVCDYASPGVGSARSVGAWLNYTAPGVAEPLSK